VNREFFLHVFPPLGPVVHHDLLKSDDSDEEIESRQNKTKEVSTKHLLVCVSLRLALDFTPLFTGVSIHFQRGLSVLLSG
jgi:hypothetical protein